MNSKNLNIVESLIFLSSEPFKQEDLNIVYEQHAEVPNLEKIVTMLNKRYTDFSYQIEAVSGGYLFVTKEEYEPFISKIYPSKKLTLSKASLEVLAIIAYKQPISRQEIEEIRGVDCKGLIKNLLLKNLIKIQGRDDSVGKSLLYHTSEGYLNHFGLKDISEMPKMSEINDLENEK